MKIFGKKKIAAILSMTAMLMVTGCSGSLESSGSAEVSIDDVTGNEYSIKDGVVVYEGDNDKEAPVVQYADPEKGALIAHINVKGYGQITVRFFPEQAPLAVENFVQHAKDGYYDGLTFHRIIVDFMIQGGDPNGTGTGGDSIWKDEEGIYVPFEDEFSKYLIPIRGALCMANSGVNTNGSQFFIVQNTEYNIVDVMNLRKAGVDGELISYYKENGGACWLYEAHTVFGQVIAGWDVLDKVASVLTDGNGTPSKDVIIESIELDVY